MKSIISFKDKNHNVSVRKLFYYLNNLSPFGGSFYDLGDHLHPSEKGYHAITEAVNLTLFGSASVLKKMIINK
jgi:lysophospholipase L1-like esterase